MRSGLSIVAGVGLAITLFTTANAQDANAGRIARIEHGSLPAVQVEGRDYQPASLADLMRDQKIPGFSIVVVDGGRIAWAKAYGLADVASGRAATVDTLFQAASISKPVAATAVLDLVEEGRLTLDSDVNATLNSWTVPANDLTRASPVTLRQLLTHTAGLTVHGFEGYAAGDALPTVPQILNGDAPANNAAVVVDRAPGTGWRYSGGGFTVAQLMMTDATGEDFPTIMRDRVLGPAGMDHSSYDQPLPLQRRAEAATAYDAEGRPVAGLYHSYPEMAAAGLWTTPTDLARWSIAISDAWAGRSDVILDQATARAMLTPGRGNWGLGLEVAGEGPSLKFSHGGGNAGFRATVIAFPERGQGLALMINSDNGDAVVDAIIRAVAAEYGWPGYDPIIITPVAIDAPVLEEIAGDYVYETFRLTLAVSPDRQSLLQTTQSGRRNELIPQGSDAFREIGEGEAVSFERDAEGRVAAMLSGGVRFERVVSSAE